MKARNAAAELGVLVRPRLDLLPDHRVRRRARARASPRGSAPSESCVSMKSSVIDPVSGMSSSRRSWITTLASSRATSARITSPSGFSATPGRWTTLMTDPSAHRRSSARLAVSCGATIRRWITPGPPPGRLQGLPDVVRDRLLVLRPKVDEDVPQLALGEECVVAQHLDVGGHAGGAQPADRGPQLDLVVEAGGAQVADADLGHHHVRARFHHPRVPSGHLAPELGHQHVEPRHVMRVEDHVLRVALRVPHTQAVGERRATAAAYPGRATFPSGAGCSAG